MGSPRFLSPTDEVKESASLKVDLPNTTNATSARFEGERSSVNLEGIKIKARSKSESDLESNFWDPRKRSTVTRVINHKRKFSEGMQFKLNYSSLVTYPIYRYHFITLK